MAQWIERERNFLFISLLCSSLLFSAHAKAQLIVDTGTPVGGPDWLYSPGLRIAGEFSISEAFSVNSVESYFSVTSVGGNMLVSIHTDAGNIPGAVIYTESFAIPVGSSLDWYGINSLDWLLSAGTYWVSVISESANLGIMPGYAPNPMDEYAFHFGGAWQDDGANAYDYLGVGYRINATVATTPEPITFVLIGLGIAGISHHRRKQSKAA